MTTRLPYDVAISAARNANARRWSLSEYVAWCVERMIANRPGEHAPTPPPVVHSTDPERTDVPA